MEALATIPKTMTRHFYIYFLVVFMCFGCEGSFWASGKIYRYKNGYQVPLDSVKVEAYYYRTLSISRTTDTSGYYEVGGLATPGKGDHLIIFTRKGFQTDTVRISHKTKTIVTYNHVMTQTN